MRFSVSRMVASAKRSSSSVDHTTTLTETQNAPFFRLDHNAHWIAVLAHQHTAITTHWSSGCGVRGGLGQLQACPLGFAMSRARYRNNGRSKTSKRGASSSSPDCDLERAGRHRGRPFCTACNVSKKRSTLRTGPDGSRTLCGACYWKYSSLRLHVYRDKNGNVSAAWKSGARPVKLLGFRKKDGVRDLTRPKTSSFAPNKRPSRQEGLCIRCKQKASPGVRSGPDGPRTLCLECFDLYRDCQLTLFQQACGFVSVVQTPGSLPVYVKGFKKTTPREHFLHPVVAPLLPRRRECSTVRSAADRNGLVDMTTSAEHAISASRLSARPNTQSTSSSTAELNTNSTSLSTRPDSAGYHPTLSGNTSSGVAGVMPAAAPPDVRQTATLCALPEKRPVETSEGEIEVAEASHLTTTTGESNSGPASRSEMVIACRVRVRSPLVQMKQLPDTQDELTEHEGDGTGESPRSTGESSSSSDSGRTRSDTTASRESQVESEARATARSRDVGFAKDQVEKFRSIDQDLRSVFGLQNPSLVQYVNDRGKVITASSDRQLFLLFDIFRPGRFSGIQISLRTKGT